jgi:hypothetical protein
MRHPILLILLIAGCGSSTRILLDEPTDPRFESGASFAIRGEDQEILVLSKGQIYSLEEMAPILDEPDPTLMDMTCAPDGEILILTGKGVQAVEKEILTPLLDEKLSADARIAAGEEWIWVSTTHEKKGYIIRFRRDDPKGQAVTGSDTPITALAPGLDGCYFASDGKVYRAYLSEEEETVKYIFILAIPGEKIRAIAPDRDHEILYVSTPSATYFCREGRVRPFHMVGGRILYDDGSLFVSSKENRAITEITRAHEQVEEIEGQ